jgi:hypothetical protein
VFHTYNPNIGEAEPREPQIRSQSELQIYVSIFKIYTFHFVTFTSKTKEIKFKCHKIHTWNTYNSVDFSIEIKLNNQNHYLILGHYHHRKPT